MERRLRAGSLKCLELDPGIRSLCIWLELSAEATGLLEL